MNPDELNSGNSILSRAEPLELVSLPSVRHRKKTSLHYVSDAVHEELRPRRTPPFSVEALTDNVRSLPRPCSHRLPSHGYMLRLKSVRGAVM